MKLCQHIRLAGAVTCIIGAVTSMLIVTAIGLMLVSIGAIWQLDLLEARLSALEKGDETDE